MKASLRFLLASLLILLGTSLHPSIYFILAMAQPPACSSEQPEGLPNISGLNSHNNAQLACQTALCSQRHWGEGWGAVYVLLSDALAKIWRLEAVVFLALYCHHI